MNNSDIKDIIAQAVSTYLNVPYDEVYNMIRPGKKGSGYDWTIPCFKLGKMLNRDPFKLAHELTFLFKDGLTEEDIKFLEEIYGGEDET
jgi:hypothetical protein